MSSTGSVSPSAAPGQAVFNLRQAFKLALSMVLFYWLALRMNWDVPHYGGLAIVIISLGTSGATIEKGLMRFVGTTVGVGVGFLVLGLFNHDRWAVMLAFASYLTLIGYFMQASRYSYAWYVAAFVPLVVWGDNYPNFGSAFYFGVFRYLETTVGILIYTAVDLVLWPRSAGDQLHEQGQELWSRIGKSFAACRQQLEDKRRSGGELEPPTDTLAGFLTKVFAVLQDAYADTPKVRAQRSIWEVWRIQVCALVDALEAWQKTLGNLVELDLERLAPPLNTRLDVLGRRLERIAALWQQSQGTEPTPEAGDRLSLEPSTFDLEKSKLSELGGDEQRALLDFARQLAALDRASCDLLRVSRVLAGLDCGDELRVSPARRHLARLFDWDRGRVVRALFPPVAFVAAFFFWLLVNPPTGAKVPMFAGILSLVLLRTPMNPLPLLVVFIVSIFVAVAPIYWLVMPVMSTGTELLGLIFIYSFVFGFLGGRSPALKSGPLIMFVTMAGISNQQVYSFTGTVDGALMIVVAGGIITIVYAFFPPQYFPLRR